MLDKNGVYTTRSMYRTMSFRGVTNKRMHKLWKIRLPTKLKDFMWQALQDKSQSRVELKKRCWKGDRNCSLCVKPEDTDHILFACGIARFVWLSRLA